LLVADDHVLVVDFKTGRRAPATIDMVSRHHLQQMAAYVAALGVIFPGRRVEAALLYTAGPRLLRLTPALIEAHKPGFTPPEQKLEPAG
jgi:ATP-dependent helicase/nuclease subunit A